jgi:hypothetical protein
MTKSQPVAKLSNSRDLGMAPTTKPTLGPDTTVSALFVAKYTNAKEIKRNEKRQDKIQKKLAQASA